MNKVQISVVIPLYNKEKYISRTIRSVLNQTYPNFELVIVDDGSTDRSSEVLKSFRDERIKYFKKVNEGVSAARNFGLKKSAYNFVAFLDADDEWKKNFLEEFAAIISKYPNYVGYSCKFQKVEGKERDYFTFSPQISGELKNYYKYCFWGTQLITSSTVCLNKKKLKLKSFEELFPVGVKRGEDLDAWTRLNLTQNFFFINKTLVHIHVDDNSASNKPFSYGEAFDYKKWFQYRADNAQKRFYLKLYAFKKILKVYAKTIGLPTIKKILTDS